MPGAQQIGEQEGLFVRGGAGTEAKTLIDGMIVNNPFYASTPDIAQRGRFSPFLFKVTIFSTGGYSAQYGQALSSVLVLETQDMPDKSSSNYSLSVVGGGAGYIHLSKDKKTSIGFDANYTNIGPYLSVVKQNVSYNKFPEFVGSSVYFRRKTGNNGILKFYGYYNGGGMKMRRFVADSSAATFKLQNDNIYSNLSYKTTIGSKWSLNAGSSFSNNQDYITPNDTQYQIRSDLFQTRSVLSRSLGSLSILRVGAEYQQYFDSRAIIASNLKQALTDNLVAAFTEVDWYLNHRLVGRIGLRSENSSILNKANIAPRASISYKTGGYSQVAFAYGVFYQKPLTNYLFFDKNLNYENATHYVLNYQWIKDDYTVRIETYRKDYKKLTTFDNNNPFNYDNRGGGFAQGLDVFWRDKKTFKGVDYWVSYTFLDTKRQYLNYPMSTTPTFATPHTGTLVFKKFASKINSQVGATYTYATGRPYFNPNNPIFLGDKTPAFQSLSLNASVLRTVRGAFCVLALSVTNVLGNTQIFGYRYSADGQTRTAITPPAPRFFFAGLFISIGQNRQEEVLNNNN